MSIILANFGKYAISDCPFISMLEINGYYENQLYVIQESLTEHEHTSSNLWDV